LSTSSLRWVESTGGPLVVLSQDLAGEWSGYAGPDYDLACTIDGFVGFAPEGDQPRPGPVLVLGGEPLRTTFLADSRCLVRWNYAESEEGLLAAVRERLAGEDAWDEGVAYDVAGPTVLMDASLPGPEADGEWLELDLPSGEYDVRTLFFESGDTSAVLHRFTPRFVEPEA
jgi:hypothetical protein